MTSTTHIQWGTHLVAAAAYGFTSYYAFFKLHIPMMSQRFKEFNPGQLMYLTMWCLIAQSIFFFLCLLNDFAGSNAVTPKKRPFIRRFKDYFHATFSFPLAMFVGVTFWSLMFIDRELVLPKALDPYFPWWLNHLMHTLIMFTTVIELVVAPRQYPKRSDGLTGLISLMIVYLVWVHIIHAKSGIWVYPVMEVLTLPLRIVFFLVLFAFATILYFVGEALDNFIWGKRRDAECNRVDLKV